MKNRNLDKPRIAQRKELRKQARVEKKKRQQEYHGRSKRVKLNTDPADDHEKPNRQEQHQLQKQFHHPSFSKPKAKSKSEQEKAAKLKEKNPDLYESLKRDHLIESADLESEVHDSNGKFRDELDVKRFSKKLKMKTADSITNEFVKDGLDFILDICGKKSGSPEAPDGSSEESDSQSLGGESMEEEEEYSEVSDFAEESEIDEHSVASDDIEESDFDQEESEYHSTTETINESENDSFDDSIDENIEKDEEPREVQKEEEEEKKQVVEKYVPRFARQQESANKSEEYMRVQRQLQGHLNRLSESNIESIFMAIEMLYGENRRHDVTEILTNRILTIVSNNSNLLEGFIMNYACLFALVFSAFGVDVGAHFVQELVELFEKNHDSIILDSCISRDDQEKENHVKKCSNLLVLICHLYNFQVISNILVFDIFERIIKLRDCQNDVDLVLKLVRIAGFKLRAEDPLKLKQAISDLQTETQKVESPSARLKFMLEQVYNLKNNKGAISKKAVSNDNSDILDRLKKFYKNFLNKRSINEAEALRCSLDDIKSVKTKGKWWVVGAAWVGRQHHDETLEPLKKPDQTDPNELNSDIQQTAGLLTLARKLGVNTDVRRQVFVVLMSSEDYADAFERLMKLNLKAKQEREIVRMIFYCAGLEKRYNPYYALLANRLCQFNRNYKMTFQFTLWDFFQQLSSGEQKFTIRRLTNIALLYGNMVETRSLTLSVLKAVDFGLVIKDSLKKELSPICIFLQIFLTSILIIGGGGSANNEREVNDEIAELFGRLCSTSDLRVVCQALRMVITNLLKNRVNGEIGSIVQAICVIKGEDYKKVMGKLVERINLARKCLRTPANMLS